MNPCPRCGGPRHPETLDDEVCLLCQLVDIAQAEGLYDIEHNPLRKEDS